MSATNFVAGTAFVGLPRSPQAHPVPADFVAV